MKGQEDIMKRLRVAFNNEQNLIEITAEFKRLLRSCCKRALIDADFDENSEISVSFVDNERIREINREFDLDPDSECYALGDIIISTEHASKQAEEIGHSTEHEIAFLVIHSMLHLLGYDHPDEESQQTKEMRRMEKLIQSELGLI